jgi:hypothetical protein
MIHLFRLLCPIFHVFHTLYRKEKQNTSHKQKTTPKGCFKDPHKHFQINPKKIELSKGKSSVQVNIRKNGKI